MAKELSCLTSLERVLSQHDGAGQLLTANERFPFLFVILALSIEDLALLDGLSGKDMREIG